MNNFKMENNSTDVSENSTFSTQFVVTQTLMCVLVVFVYVIGIYLHSRVMLVCKKEQEMTWKLDILNSCVVLINYGHVIIMYSLTYLVADLHTFTGNWFCYISKALTLYGNTQVISHSYIISLMKYVMIVYQQKVTAFGKSSIKAVFFWFHLLYPVYLNGMVTVARPDYIVAYDSINQANRCLGKTDVYKNENATRLFHLCMNIPEPHQKLSLEYAVYYGRKSICWFHVILFFLNYMNILEIFIYYQIFTYMKG